MTEAPKDERMPDPNACRACEFADEAAFAGATHDLDRPPHSEPFANGEGPGAMG